jgi:hypothetical protein
VRLILWRFMRRRSSRAGKGMDYSCTSYLRDEELERNSKHQGPNFHLREDAMADKPKKLQGSN